MKTCDECGGKHYAKGKCALHYKMPSQLNPKPIKVNIVTTDWKDKQAKIKASKTKKAYIIPNVSEKQKERLKRYRKLRDAYMEDHKYCEAQLSGCTILSKAIHHKKGRIGDNLFNHFLAVCDRCHDKIEVATGNWVYEQGFKIKRTE